MVESISGLTPQMAGMSVSNNQKPSNEKGVFEETDWTTNAADAVSKAFKSVDNIENLFQSE